MEEFSSQDEHFLRPFILTGGRTTAHVPVEAIAVTKAGATRAMQGLGIEHQDILLLCEIPHAVIEIAAKLKLPLGVVRTLVSDLSNMGFLHIPQTVSARADVSLVERLIDGIRRR